MSSYVIFTDTGSDIKSDLLKEWGVQKINMTFQFENEGVEYTGDGMSVKAFYDRMREGSIAKTSAINIAVFEEAFEACLKEGKDVLYLAFSSGLSTTYNSACIAAEQLHETYPDRKVLVVDSLAASAGQGLHLYLTVRKQQAGATVEEAAAYAEEIKLNICHWVTLDNLVYLKRGGRISPTAAFFGNALGIKPIIHVDNEGRLINVEKIRGWKKSLAYLADKYSELAEDPASGSIFISHSDCEEDAKAVANLIQEKHGMTVEIITDIGPVIGAHTGPGTVALFFVGRER